MLMVAANGACRVKVLDGGIANIFERSKILYTMVSHVEGQRMALTVEGAAIVVFIFPADHR